MTDARSAAPTRPVLAHLTTTDMSLALLLGPQLSAFRDAGFDVVGISAPGPWSAQLHERGIRHVPLHHATRAMDPLADLRAMAELVRVLRRLRPTILHTHNPKPGLYGRLAGRLTGVPIVVNTVHGLYALPGDRWTKRAVVYTAEWLASRASDAELLQNEEDLPVLARIGVPRAKLSVLGNGIDLARFDPGTVTRTRRSEVRADLGITEDRVVIGAVGRLVREKGYRELFTAARRVVEDGRAVTFVVVGPTEPDKADAITSAEIAAAERDTDMRFLGLRDDMVELYAAMDLFVLPSYREGFPRAAMEAAAMGLPVVTTDIRGGRQVVDDGTSGLLVPPRDAGRLAEAIGRLVDDHAMRRAMGAASRAKAAREFDEQRQIGHTLDVYRALLSRTSPDHRLEPG